LKWALKLGARTVFVIAGMMLIAAQAAPADDWFPHPSGAKWQYDWSDTKYNPVGIKENVVVQQQQGPSFTLAWADTQDQLPQPNASSLSCGLVADIGTMTFQDGPTGLINTNWNSCPPFLTFPPQFLCQSGATSCPDSLSGSLYNVIWGSRNPVLAEPLLQGTSWNGTGGAAGNVSSSSQYLGVRLVKVPAFPDGVMAAVVQTNLSLAGTQGDAYGSGIRTTWWVYGIGPVKVEFDHVDGSVTNVVLLSTTLRPLEDPSDQNYFPLHVGLHGTYRWSNRKHLAQPEVETLSVSAVAASSARIDVKSVSGPLRGALKGGLVGAYGFDLSLSGLSNIWGYAAVATQEKFPHLGHARHFFTPVDLMTYGFGPLLPAYAQSGAQWRSGNAYDMKIYGVTGSTKILGVQTVHVPAGTFQALAVRSVLTQRGHPFGSGVRTMWFAPGRGLVKLLFKHGDGSVSLVQLLR
jgi:hypothetical protein